MKQYYVVLRQEEKDNLKDTIDAPSLEEAFAIAKIRYQEEIGEDESLFVYSANDPFTLDENHRFINNDGISNVCIKL